MWEQIWWSGEFLSWASVGLSFSAASSGKVKPEVIVIVHCHTSLLSQCGQPFPMGNDPTTFSRVLGEIFWKNDFFGSRCYLFWALFFNFKGSGPQGRRGFLPEKAESRTWPSCSGLSQVTCFLDFPLNLLSPLSWCWIRKTDKPFSPLDYKYLNTSVEYFNM